MLWALLWFQVPILELEDTLCNLERHFGNLRWITGYCRCLKKYYKCQIQFITVTNNFGACFGASSMDHSRVTWITTASSMAIEEFFNQYPLFCIWSFRNEKVYFSFRNTSSLDLGIQSQFHFKHVLFSKSRHSSRTTQEARNIQQAWTAGLKARTS